MIITGSETQTVSKITVSGKDILSVSKMGEIRTFTCEEYVHCLLSRHSHGILHYSFVPQGQTVKLTWLYNDILRRVCWKNVWRKGPGNCNSRDWFLHHNATARSPSSAWISDQQQNECRFTSSLHTNAVCLPSCPTIQDDVLDGIIITPRFKQNLGTHLSNFKQCTSRNASNGSAIVGIDV